MMKKKKIITAWAEPASGPGWSNKPVWYIYQDDDGVLHQDCLQPEEQNKKISEWYGISFLVHASFTGDVRAKVNGEEE